MTPEGKVKKQVRDVLRDHGHVVLPMNMNGYGSCGVPDDLLVWNGNAIFIEYKAHMRWDSNKPVCLNTLPRMNQVLSMDKLRSAGANIYVVDDVTANGFIRGVLAGRMSALDPFLWRWTFEQFNIYRANPWDVVSTWLDEPVSGGVIRHLNMKKVRGHHAV